MTDVNEFAMQLKVRVGERARSRQGYVLAGDLGDAIDAALKGPDAVSDDFPRMLFSPDDRNNYRIVNGPAEQEAALADGWSLDAPPQYETGYPRWVTENPQRKVWDLRSILLHSSDEEQTFHATTEPGDWIDDPERTWGGRGVALSELVEERKNLRKALIDLEPLVSLDQDLAHPPDTAGASEMADQTPCVDEAPAPANKEEEEES